MHARISSALQRRLDTAPSGDRLRVMVRFKAQADIARLRMKTLAPRSPVARALLVSALQSTADSSQRAFDAFLAQPALAGQVSVLRQFWIFNGEVLSASPQAIRAIAARTDVSSVSIDEWRRWISSNGVGSGVIQPTAPFSRTGAFAFQLVSAPAVPPWGIQRIRADQVWSGLGISGTGVTVATIDTGVDWQHPALQTNYRGWNGRLPPDHLHNWYDATDEGSLYPTDMNGHGTHTMGTIVGLNGIGVAPGARWMAAKGLNGQGYGYDSWLHAAFEFMLAPGSDPSYAPDVVSNSWGNSDGTSSEFAPDIAALQAAGIFVVFANGNNGPMSGTVGSPASLPSAVGVGATDPDDEVTSFSSRGPSPFGPVKPDISAPGLNVVSSYPGGSYASASGTSMATPHVAGTVALILSAVPTLSITATLFVLTSTAVPIGTNLPNNDAGWGRVDAYSATLSVLSTGVIQGFVLDGAQPVSDAIITAATTSSGVMRRISSTSDGSGHYAIVAPTGIYTLTAHAFGYYDSAPSSPVLVVSGQVRTVNFSLDYMPSGVVRGTVRAAATSGDVISGTYLTATLVSALGTPRASFAGYGAYPPYRYYLDLPAGTYTVEAHILGYVVQTATVTVDAGAVVDADFDLTPTQRIALVDTGAWYYQSAASYYQAALDALALPYDYYRVKHIPTDVPSLTTLLGYDTVIWSAPYDSPGLIGAQDVILGLLTSGRNIVLSGQDIGYYDGGGYIGPFPYYRSLDASYVADNTPSRTVVGEPGSLLSGKVLTITGGDGAGNQDLVDVVTVLNPDYGTQIGHYTSNQNGYDGAGVYSQLCRPFRSAYFAFGIEGINNAADRMDVLRRTLNAFDVPRMSTGVELLSRDQFATGVPIGLPGQVITHVIRLRNTGDAGITDTFSLALNNAPGSQGWPAWLSSSQVTLAPCQSSLLTVTVTIPLTATWNTVDVVALTAYSTNSPTVSNKISLTTKTPAGMLVVDDDRFFNVEQDYLDALAANGNVADLYDTGNNTGHSTTPPLDTLRMYPQVVWFTAYDWYSPISLAEEGTLCQYLDGGGRLFFTSQAALDYTMLSSFNQNYLGVASIDFNDVTSNVVGAPGNAIGDGFQGGSLLPFPYNWNLSSAIQPISGTLVILRGDSGQPFGLARECSTCTYPWRTVFMPFAFEALTNTVQADLMNRVTGWLTWLGDSSLSPENSAVSAGGLLTYVLRLHMDRAAATAIGSLTTSVNISVPLDANLTVVSSTLDGSTVHNAGYWHGSMRFGDVMTFTFVAAVAPALNDGTSLTATLLAALDEPGLHFSRDSVIHVNAPVLSSLLTVQPERVQWGNALTFTLRVTNSSAVSAPAVSITDVLPIGLSTVPPVLISGSSPGAYTEGNRILWSGTLASGQVATLTYLISMSMFSSDLPRAFYNAALIDNGDGDITQAATWVAPYTPVYYLPVVAR